MASYSSTDESAQSFDYESSYEEKRPTSHQLTSFISVMNVALYGVLVYTVIMAECPLDDKWSDGFHLTSVAIYAILSLAVTLFAIASARYEDRESRACVFVCYLVDSTVQTMLFFVAGWFIVAHLDQIIPFIGIFALCMIMNAVQAVNMFMLIARHHVPLQDIVRLWPPAAY